ncbi:MAG TPA: hypothetical protein VHZ78_04520 [Rhizomicrobium sp.]|jgi:hypothetical protein|nr:hypothetical protein [Rhizomicrobium sp.]
MALNRQPDLFLKDIQPDMLEDQPAQAYRADPDKVRAELNRMLAEARATQAMRPATVKLYQTLFPQMTNWLPEAEAAQLRFEFDVEMARLKAA